MAIFEPKSFLGSESRVLVIILQTPRPVLWYLATWGSWLPTLPRSQGWASACCVHTQTLTASSALTHTHAGVRTFLTSQQSPQGAGTTHLASSPPAPDTHAQALSVPHNQLLPKHRDSVSYSQTVSLPPVIVIHGQSHPLPQSCHTPEPLQHPTARYSCPNTSTSHTHTPRPATAVLCWPVHHNSTPQLSPQQEGGNPRERSPLLVTRSV